MMSDYVEHLDNILKSTGENVLQGSGHISHEEALNKAKAEYRKYQERTISPVEQAYLDTIKEVEQTAKKNVRKW